MMKSRGFTSFSVRLTMKAKSNGKKKTASTCWMLLRATLWPVIVVVETKSRSFG